LYLTPEGGSDALNRVIKKYQRETEVTMETGPEWLRLFSATWKEGSSDKSDGGPRQEEELGVE